VTRTAAEQRTLVVRGIAWNTLYQVFQTVVSFGAMLVLVRVIPPADYGRMGTVIGALTLLNAFNCGVFMTQSLQLPDGVEPDWSAHYAAGMRIQLVLSTVCHGVAGAFWLLPTYRPVAPMMHIAALGLLLDCPNQLGLVRLQRHMDFRRLRIITACATVANLGITIALALVGAGRFALVLNMNVLTGLPFAIDLLLVQRWRPARGWFAPPSWRDYKPTFRWGFQQAGMALLHAGRGAASSAVLPTTLGFVAMGLLARAQSFFQTTVGKLVSVLIETVYPLLPRYAARPESYPRYAQLFIQVILWVGVPGTIFLGLEGPLMSRIIYGAKWAAADPLLWPASLFGLGTVLAMAGASVLLAANRLRVCLLLDILGAVLTVPLVLLTLRYREIEVYAWAFGIGTLLAGLISLLTATTLLPRGWFGATVLPAAVAVACGAGAAVLVGRAAPGLPAALRLALSATVYGLGSLAALRLAFARPLRDVLGRLPGGPRLARWLLLAAPEPG
jgi:O-antigen/teichoic acid export membrane protein